MENPVAAPQGTEAVPTTPTDAGPAPAAPQAPATPAPAPAQPVANIPANKIEEFNRFIAGNGGFDKAFAKLRSDVSTPAPQQQMPQTITQPQAQQPQMPQQYQQYQQYQQQQYHQELPKGYVSQEELNVKRVYDDFARDPGYAPIKDELSSGEIFKTMSRFGISPVGPNGSVNVGQVKDFLDMYAKSKAPAIAPSAPVTSTPTVDYVNVGEKITSRDDALAIMRQNMSLNGVAPHPQTEAAKEFLKTYFKK